MKKIMFWSVILVLLCFKSDIWGQNSHKNNYLLQEYVDSLSQTEMLQNAHIGISIKKCDTKAVVFDFNAQKLLKPASTLKLITTGNALAKMGPNKVFTTKIDLQGKTEQKTFSGDIIIEPGGDPSFGSWRFENKPDYEQIINEIVQKLKSEGISKIKGSIKIKGNEDLPPVSWPWGDIGNYYGAHYQSFMFFENCIQAYFDTQSNGTLAIINKTIPDAKPFEIGSEVTANNTAKGDNTSGYVLPNYNKIIVNGTLPVERNQFKTKLSNPNPKAHFIYLLKTAFNTQNIVFENFTIDKNGNERVNLLSYKSPKLLELAQQTNFQSINLYAEALHVAYEMEMNANTITQNKQWAMDGLDTLQIQQKDGSGLSPSNYVSPHFLTDFLNLQFANTSHFKNYLTSIPKVGIEGTVKNLVPKKSKTVGKVWAKSGTIEKVKCYAGYFQNKKGDWYSFALMANQFNCSQSQMNAIWSRMINQLPDLE